MKNGMECLPGTLISCYSLFTKVVATCKHIISILHLAGTDISIVLNANILLDLIYINLYCNHRTLCFVCNDPLFLNKKGLLYEA